MSNAQIATLAVGTFSVTGGGNLVWSLIAIVAGALLGTFFMAFHSAQGPQLGLPLYYVLAQSVDVEAKTRVAEARELEEPARQHLRPEETH